MFGAYNLLIYFELVMDHLWVGFLHSIKALLESQLWNEFINSSLKILVYLGFNFVMMRAR